MYLFFFGGGGWGGIRGFKFLKAVLDKSTQQWTEFPFRYCGPLNPKSVK